MTQQREDVLLDRAIDQIHGYEPDPQVVASAAARVWEKLQSDAVETAVTAAEVTEIRGCDDYQALIPALLADALPPARKLLLEEHTRECVPCRRALKDAREGKAPAERSAPSVPATSSPVVDIRTRRRPFVQWALAAALIAGLGMTLFFISESMRFGGPAATVQTVDGDLFRVAESAHLPIAAGDQVLENESLRTGRSGGAVVRLNDGSLIEMRERSEISVEETRRGTVIHLNRGNVIVQAAKQRERQLFVATDDCRVAVTGTIFSVNHGTKGSRVSVVEGEVRVTYSGEEAILHPGEQVTTQALLATVPVKDEISWSRDVDQYLELLREYAELRREIERQLPRPELRYDRKLLDLMPEGTVLFAAVPNLAETASETHRVIRERIEASPVLQQWWAERDDANHLESKIDEVMAKLDEFSDYLGNEIAVGGVLAADGSLQGPLALVDMVNAAGFRDFIENLEPGLHDGVVFIDDPAGVTPAEGDEIYLWLRDDLVVASPEISLISTVAGFLGGEPNGFVGTAFHGRLGELYDEGVDILVAADLEHLLPSQFADETQDSHEVIRKTGALDMQHFMAEQKKLDKTYHRAVLTFSEARHGIASWLAEPAPMGALELISPDAKAVAALVFKDPVKMLDDLLEMSEGDADGSNGLLAEIRRFEESYGLSLRDDFAAVLGGEVAMALDGPMLPTPAWKVVIEVYDPARFQWTLEQALAEINVHLQQEGHPALELERLESGGRTYYRLPTEFAEVHYTFVEGYLVAAPTRAHVDRTIRFHEAGQSFLNSRRFAQLLPIDSHNNFSALVYQDMGEIMSAMADKIAQGQLTDEQQQALNELKNKAEPTLVYCYAEDRRIVVAAATQTDLVSALLMQMLGFQNPAGIEQLLGPLMGFDI